MDITQVKIFPVHEEKLKAFVSIVFDHCFMINDIKVIQGKDGLFLSMPSRRKRNGEFKDVAHPLNNETRRAIEERVLGDYRRLVDDVTPRRPDRPFDEDLPSDAAIRVSPAIAPPVPGHAAAAAAVASTGVREGGGGVVPASAGAMAASAVAAREVGEPAPRAEVSAPAERTVSAEAEEGLVGDPDTASEGDRLEEVQRVHLSDSFWSVS